MGKDTAFQEGLNSRMQAHELGQFRVESVPTMRTGGRRRPESGPYLADGTEDCECFHEVQGHQIQLR
ncbi:hypothetical protein IG631_11167 [Alternaria alternata]|nr:hypothetical protein IG631_11167 [Alternaria alternata]